MINNIISDVYLCDCMEYMRNIPNKFFNISIVDPPYGINAEQGTNRASRKQFKNEEYGWDSGIPSKEYFDELKRVSEHQIIWGGNYFLDYLGKCKHFIIWDKLNPDRCFGDCEFAWSSLESVPRVYKEKRVQELNKLDGGKIHPTQKPCHLYFDTMKRYSKKGDKILDTHLGSGSSRIAAYILGIDFYACEKKESFYLAQEERFQKFLSEKSLFLPAQEQKKDAGLFDKKEDDIFIF